jgi:general secretion pathway protein H
MPTSATGSSERGFTLVELMVAMVIIGIASAALVMALPGPGAGVRPAAERLAARLVLARDIAISEGADIAVAITPDASIIQRRDGGQWVPLADPAIASRPIEDGLVVVAEPQGPLVFDATGLATPGHVQIRQGETVAGISVDAVGGVRVEAR